MLVQANSTDVTTYFHLRLAADGTDATGLTITNIDLQYCRSGATPAAKVDATALGAANSAHSDNTAFEIDGTDQPGVYRVDWPDAAFASGVREVILTVKVATAFTESLRVQIVGFDPSTDLSAAVWAAATRTLTAIDEDNTTLDLDATIRAAVGLASANLDTQLDALPTAAENATQLLDVAAGVETNRTVRQSLRLMLAALAGKASGMATTTAVFRDTNDSKDRITATVDADGNRSAVTLDAT